MRKQSKFLPWLIGLIIASLFFGMLLSIAAFEYSGTDDAPILRSFMGYEGGAPATFHLYLHTAFAWLLHGLATLFPTVAWFSVLQLFLLWLSEVVIVKSAVQLARRRKLGRWVGALGGAAFLMLLTMYISCRVSYTTTAALCGAAAVAQLTSVDFTALRKRSIIGPMLGGAALLLCCYCLRQISVLPPLCFWLLALAIRLLTTFGGKAPRIAPSQDAPSNEARQTVDNVSVATADLPTRLPWSKARPVLTACVAIALIFGAFIGVRAIDLRVNNAADFLDWQNARIDLFDYTDFDATTTPETLEKVDWSDAEFTLIKSWYFMDDNISADAFRTLSAQQTADDGDVTIMQRLTSAWRTVRDCFAGDKALLCGLIAVLTAAVGAMLLYALRREWLPLLGAVCAVLGAFILLMYLGWRGRLPMRAALSVLLPLAAYVLTTWTASLARTGAVNVWRPLAIAAVCAVALWMGVEAFATTAPIIRPVETDGEVVSNVADLDEYALYDPDTLFIYDLSLVSDRRLFPDVSEGIASNVMFWGGYPARSPSWYAMLAKYDVEALDGSIFLRDNVILASTDPEPWASLCAYVSQFVPEGETLDWTFYGSYGYVNFFQFSTY